MIRLFMSPPRLSIWSKDWTIPGIWDHIGCEGLDEQVGHLGFWAEILVVIQNSSVTTTI